MDEDVINDLKQFITATISQAMANVATKDDIEKLSAEIKEVKDAINESVIPYTSQVDEQVQDHEKRIVKLEQRTA